MIAKIEGNSCGKHFSVSCLDSNSESIELLVNCTETYQGTVPIDFYDGDWTKRLEIHSSCKWEITLMSIAYARILDVPGQIEGNGDDVIILLGGMPDLGNIISNAQRSHFAVTEFGTVPNLLVNTTDPYEGTVLINSATNLLVIDASCPWSIKVSPK